jgi:hypothetical protein
MNIKLVIFACLEKVKNSKICLTHLDPDIIDFFGSPMVSHVNSQFNGATWSLSSNPAARGGCRINAWLISIFDKISWLSNIYYTSVSFWSIGIPGGWGSRAKKDVDNITFESSTYIWSSGGSWSTSDNDEGISHQGEIKLNGKKLDLKKLKNILYIIGNDGCE